MAVQAHDATMIDSCELTLHVEQVPSMFWRAVQPGVRMEPEGLRW